MRIAWFRGLIVCGRAVASRALVRFQSVPSPCMCAERLFAASPYMPVCRPFRVSCSPVVCPSEARWLCAVIPFQICMGTKKRCP